MSVYYMMFCAVLCFSGELSQWQNHIFIFLYMRCNNHMNFNVGYVCILYSDTVRLSLSYLAPVQYYLKNYVYFTILTISTYVIMK